jgi:hypothetical protein
VDDDRRWHFAGLPEPDPPSHQPHWAIETAWNVALILLASAIIAALLWLLPEPSRGAPVPSPKPAKPIEIVPGMYSLTWAGCTRTMPLTAAGNYSWDGWHGTWVWEAKKRTLHIRETINGSVWENWEVVLDDQGYGRTTGDQGRVPVVVRRKKP